MRRTEGRIAERFLRIVTPAELDDYWRGVVGGGAAEGIDLTELSVSYRTLDVVAGNSNFITLRNLEPGTQYQVTVVAVKGGKRYRSRPTIFLTMGKTAFRNLDTSYYVIRCPSWETMLLCVMTSVAEISLCLWPEEHWALNIYLIYFIRILHSVLYYTASDHEYKLIKYYCWLVLQFGCQNVTIFIVQMHLMLCRTSRSSKYLSSASPRLNHYRGVHYSFVKQWRTSNLEKPTAEYPSAGRGGGHCHAGSGCLDSCNCPLLQPLGQNSHAAAIPTRLQRAAQGTGFWGLCCGSRGSLPWPTAWFKPGLPTGKYIRIGSWDRKFD